MGKKEDKKDKSKGLVYVTNGDSKTPGLPDPEMSAPSDDVSSEGLSQKKGRRCGRYRCPVITVGVVIVLAALACAIYFSVTILMEDDKMAANSSMTARSEGAAGQRSQNTGTNFVTVSSTTEDGGPDMSNSGSLMRGVPGRPMGSMLRGVPTAQASSTVATTGAPSSNQGGAAGGMPPQLAMRRRTVPRPPPPAPTVNGTEAESAGETGTDGEAGQAPGASEGGSGGSGGSPPAGASSNSSQLGSVALSSGNRCVESGEGQTSGEGTGCQILVAAGPSTSDTSDDSPDVAAAAGA